MHDLMWKQTGLEALFIFTAQWYAEVSTSFYIEFHITVFLSDLHEMTFS